MKSRYDKAMEYIEVTPEMQDRIMRNLCDIDFSQNRSQKQSKVIPFKHYRKFVTVAACFMVLLVSSVFIYNYTDIFNQQPPVQIVSGVIECPSLDELSKLVGFEVYEVQSLPFNIGQTEYFSYWEELAQIVYSGEGNSLTYRMSVGSEDNSGDYGKYSDEQTISIGDIVVTLKGQDGLYKLAIWHAMGYSYSVNSSKGISQEEMVKMVKSVW